MSIGVLIVGLGQIGMGYDLDLDPAQVYSHARAFSSHPGFHLCGGVDPEFKRRKTFEEVFRCAAFAEVEAALDKLRPDLAVIAVPTRQHGQVLRQVLSQSALRAVLCEKPLSYEPAEARDMARTCAAKNVSLYVNYMRRSDPAAIEIRRRLDTGEIAGPVKGVAWYSKGFIHNGSHFFNLLEYWLGPIKSAKILDPGRLWENTDPEPDVRVVFDRGTVVFLAAREEAFSHYTIELVAANGRLRYDRGGERVSWQPASADPNFHGYSTLSAVDESIASGMDRYQWNVAEQLGRALEGSGHFLCTGREALATVESMHTILQQR